jgi:hypothetical protein
VRGHRVLDAIGADPLACRPITDLGALAIGEIQRDARGQIATGKERS